MTSVKMIEVHLPENETTNRFLKLQKDKRELCLQIGLTCLNNTDITLENFYNQEVSVIREEEHMKLKQMEEKYEQAKTQHTLEMEELSKRIYEQTKMEHEEIIKELKATVKQKDSDFFTLQSTVESEKRSEMERFNEKMIQEITKKNEESRMRENEIRKDYEKRLDEERNKNNDIEMLKHNSSLKGKKGEEDMEPILNKLFPKAEIIRCTKEAHRGDFNILENNMKMMIDVKNYKKNVQKIEIEKFHRDMKENPDYTCGILLSMNAGICAKEDMSIEIVNERPIVYLHNFLGDTNKLKHALSIVKMIHSIKGLNLKDQEIIETIQQLQKDSKKKYISTKRELDKFYNKMTASLEEHENINKKIFSLFQRRTK